MTLELFENSDKLTPARLQAFFDEEHAGPVPELRLFHFVDAVTAIQAWIESWEPDARVYLRCQNSDFTIGISTECEFYMDSVSQFLLLFGDADEIRAATEKETEYYYLHLEFDFTI